MKKAWGYSPDTRSCQVLLKSVHPLGLQLGFKKGHGRTDTHIRTYTHLDRHFLNRLFGLRVPLNGPKIKLRSNFVHYHITFSIHHRVMGGSTTHSINI